MKVPYATILITLIVVSSYLLVSGGQPYIKEYGKMYQYSTSQMNLQRGNILGLVTYSFMHIGIKHLVLNTTILILIGWIVEEKIGWKHTLALFFITSILAGIAYSLTVTRGWVIGSSAGIAGLMVGAYLSNIKKALAALITITLVSTVLILPLTDFTLAQMTTTKEKIVNESKEKILELNTSIEKIEKEIETKKEQGKNITEEVKKMENLTSQLNQTKKIEEKAKIEKESIEQGKKTEEKTPPSNLIHLYGALAGIAYMMVFKREAFEWFLKDMKKIKEKIKWH